MRRKSLELTWLFALGGSADIGRSPAKCEGVAAMPVSSCGRTIFQEAFREELIDGYRSEAIEAMFCKALIDYTHQTDGE